MINEFLKKVKVNEYLLPVIGKVPMRMPTSVVEVNGVQIWACWMEWDGKALLRSILSGEKGKGIATKYLQQCLDLAKELKLELWVEPTTTRLKKYYKRLGFKIKK